MEIWKLGEDRSDRLILWTQLRPHARIVLRQAPCRICNQTTGTSARWKCPLCMTVRQVERHDEIGHYVEQLRQKGHETTRSEARPHRSRGGELEQRRWTVYHEGNSPKKIEAGSQGEVATWLNERGVKGATWVGMGTHEWRVANGIIRTTRKKTNGGIVGRVVRKGRHQRKGGWRVTRSG